MGFVALVTWVCAALYLACLASDAEGIRSSGLFSFLSPSMRSLFVFGASGADAGVPLRALVDGAERGLAARRRAPHPVQHALGPRPRAADGTPLRTRARGDHLHGRGRLRLHREHARRAFLPLLPRFLRGAGFTVGASAPIFGLVGALLYYGRRGGSSHIGRQAKSLAITMLLFGFIIPGVDNWAHGGGFVGGWLAARWLDPLEARARADVTRWWRCSASCCPRVGAGFSVVYGLRTVRRASTVPIDLGGDWPMVEAAPAGAQSHAPLDDGCLRAGPGARRGCARRRQRPEVARAGASETFLRRRSPG